MDVFISHSWSADRWEKHLAVCLFLNLSLAWKAAAVAVVAAQCFFVLLPEPGIDVTYVILLDLPVLLFLLLFFFGQHLTCGRWGPSLWVDRLCIDQSSESSKSEGIAGLPTIVANSSQFLVLWSESYFERLWCTFELCLFVKLCGIQQIRCVPLWMAPWLLTTILFSWIGSRLDAFVLYSDPEAFTIVLPYDKVRDSACVYGFRRAMSYMAEAPFYALTLLPSLVISIISFRRKLERHETMLTDMESFDIRAAKCSLESDRHGIEKKIAELFNQADHPIRCASPHELVGSAAETEEIMSGAVSSDVRLSGCAVNNYHCQDQSLNAFNAYVQQQVRDAVTADFGVETHLSWGLCLLTFFPAFLDFTAQCWIGRQFRSKSGFYSDFQYFSTSFATSLLGLTVNFPLSPPCFLHLMKWIVSRTGSGILSNLLLLLGGYLLNIILSSMYGLMIAMLESFVITVHPTLMAAFLLMLAAHCWLNYLLYFEERSCPCLAPEGGGSTAKAGEHLGIKYSVTAAVSDEVNPTQQSRGHADSFVKATLAQDLPSLSSWRQSFRGLVRSSQ